VDRDDLPDGGAAHFAATTRAIHDRAPGVTVELLTPDFGGDAHALATIAGGGAQVLGHNIETVRRLTPRLRDPRCSYNQSLAVLRAYRAARAAVIVKAAFSLGLGETDDEVGETLADLRTAGVDWVAFGQYLQPSRKHVPVQRYVAPEDFAELEGTARALGFGLVSAGPLVRSSYRAAEAQLDALRARRAMTSAR
jgi:lipoic acid synthetase